MFKPTSLNIHSIDVFVTTRCGLRCSHCFVGEDLNQKLDFKFEYLEKLLETAKSWNTKEITFLGGEPTLYPRIVEAVNLSIKSNYKTRIVTNGHKSYLKFLEKFNSDKLPFICFSIDGSNEIIHDNIRGKGSFITLMKSIKQSDELGFKKAAIISISKQNAFDIPNLLSLCNDLDFEYINIHYVTNRGFASKEIVLSIDEWKIIYQNIEDISKTIKPKIRIEKTFLPNVNQHLNCAVKEKNNLMFYPDNRVYMCMMFIDQINSHSFNWTDEGLILNESRVTEQSIVKGKNTHGCPAIFLVNQSIANEVKKRNEFVQCIYEKETLN
jgi:MoaA/NifB/PqqE/SkfB family radical SAM enzyme